MSIFPEGQHLGTAPGDPVILTTEDTSLDEVIYGGLQDPKTLQRWRELLWFYLEWQKKRTALV